MKLHGLKINVSSLDIAINHKHTTCHKSPNSILLMFQKNHSIEKNYLNDETLSSVVVLKHYQINKTSA